MVIGKSPTDNIQSLVKAVGILDCFLANQGGLGVRQVARQLGISPSTVGRLMVTLHSAGILSQDPATRLYQMGSKVLAWSAVYTEGLEVRSKARPMLEELYRLTGETVNLYVLDGTERVCVDNFESAQRVRVIVRIGERMPLHAGSAGKAILAYAPLSLVKQILATPLQRMTSNTITGSRALLTELERIRKAGYAISHGERFPDALGLAAPIFNATGNVVAALNVSGPSHRFTDVQARKRAPKVMQLARQVSHALGSTT